MSAKKGGVGGKVTIEEALNISGFGIYSYFHLVLTGLVIIAYACHAYSNTITIPTSACELATTSAQQGLIGATPVIGLLLGALPLSYLADIRGRKNMLILSLLVSTAVNIIRAISVNWVMLLITEFLVNFAASGQYMLAMTLLSECVPLAKRNLAVLLVTSIFLPSLGVLAVIAIPIIPLSFSYYLPALGIYWNSWRTLQVVYSIPSLITAACLYFVTESPKFTLVSGDEEGALEILRTLYRRNKGKSFEEYPVKGLIRNDQENPEKRLSAKEQIMPLFKAPLLKYLIIITLLLMLEQVGSLQIWFPTIANRFMQMVETGAPMNQTLCEVLRSRATAPPDPDAVPCSLNNTAMLIILLSGAMQAIVNLVISSVVNTLGRRNIVIVLSAICGVSGILVNVVSNTVASAALFIVYLQGYIVIGLFMAISVALFPTQVRALAVALSVSGGRVATVAVIQLLNFLLLNNCETSFYVLGTICVASALVTLLLPDDRLLRKQTSDTKSNKEYSTKL